MDEIIDPAAAVAGNEAAAHAAPEIVAAAEVAAVAAIAPESAPAATKTVRHQRKKSSVNTVSAETEVTTVVTDDEAVELPASVKLASPYAFYDDAGELQSWAAGQVVEDAAVIALLVDRGAIFEAE